MMPARFRALSLHAVSPEVERGGGRASAPAESAMPAPAPAATPSLCARPSALTLRACRFVGGMVGIPAWRSARFSVLPPRYQPPGVDCVPQNWGGAPL